MAVGQGLSCPPCAEKIADFKTEGLDRKRLSASGRRQRCGSPPRHVCGAPRLSDRPLADLGRARSDIPAVASGAFGDTLHAGAAGFDAPRCLRRRFRRRRGPCSSARSIPENGTRTAVARALISARRVPSSCLGTVPLQLGRGRPPRRWPWPSRAFSRGRPRHPAEDGGSAQSSSP